MLESWFNFSRKIVIFSYKTWPIINKHFVRIKQKHLKNSGNSFLSRQVKWFNYTVKIIGESVNLSLLFFLSSDISWLVIFIFYFFPPTWKKLPRRDLSSVEYSVGSLRNESFSPTQEAEEWLELSAYCADSSSFLLLKTSIRMEECSYLSYHILSYLTPFHDEKYDQRIWLEPDCLSSHITYSNRQSI